MRKSSRWKELFPDGFWKELFPTKTVWGLGIIVGDRQKTVVRAEDYDKIRQALDRAAEYHRKHSEK